MRFVSPIACSLLLVIVNAGCTQQSTTPTAQRFILIPISLLADGMQQTAYAVRARSQGSPVPTCWRHRERRQAGVGHGVRLFVHTACNTCTAFATLQPNRQQVRTMRDMTEGTRAEVDKLDRCVFTIERGAVQ